MTATESRLWRRLYTCARRMGRTTLFTRIETSTCLGVADVEYVTPRLHGWIELKTTHTKQQDTPLALGSPFTVQQYNWLRAHDSPATNLRSWLLIGCHSATRWSSFILVPTQVAVRFLTKTHRPSLQDLAPYTHEDEGSIISFLCGGLYANATTNA